MSALARQASGDMAAQPDQNAGAPSLRKTRSSSDGGRPRSSGSETHPSTSAGSASAASSSHPLQRSWTLWFDPGTSGQRQTIEEYGKTMLAVYTFSTLEEFWGLFNNIKPPTKLNDKATYYLFQTGISPKWEDPKNVGGGAWTASISQKSFVDQCWMDVVLAVIGEQFRAEDHVHGVSMNVRRTDRIELWTGDAQNQALQISAGEDFKKALGSVGDRAKLAYDVFADKLVNAKAKSRYTL